MTSSHTAQVQTANLIGIAAAASLAAVFALSQVSNSAKITRARNQPEQSTAAGKEATAPASGAKPEPKTVNASSVSYRMKISPEYCDEHGRVYGGELLKLIDVSAGIVAAKHAGGPCVTISADRVIFLQEIKVGDVVHLSSAVNRAWGSSMEIGVRVMRETPDAPLGYQSYCCHAYLTFVARHVPPSPPTLLRSIGEFLHIATPPKPKRFRLPEVSPQSTLETKRFLLAGRRRAHRIQRAQKMETLVAAMRSEMLEIEKGVLDRDRLAGVKDTDTNIDRLQLELLVEAHMRGDRDVYVEGDNLVASIEGFMEPVRAPMADVLKAARDRGHGGYRRLSLPSNEAVERATGRALNSMNAGNKSSSMEAPLQMSDTLVIGLWIVRPQHANSKSVLFGGCLMRWIEEISSISARRIYPSASWSSAAIDSLTFKSAVLPGEVVYIRACVVKVWDSSVEVFAIAMAEDRNSPNPTMRLVSESFLTLVVIDPQSGRPLKGVLRQVSVPEGPAREIATGSDVRREERLQDKRILQRVYA